MPFNIANDDDLKTKLAAAAAGIDDERLSKWVVKRFFALASETEALLVPFTPAMATARDWPDWVLRRMEEGADLRLFPEAGGSQVRMAFDARLASCAAFLSGMVDLSREEPAAGPAGDRRRRDVAAAGRVLDGFSKRTLEAAERLAESWREKFSKRTGGEESEEDAKIVLVVPGGEWRVARVLTVKGLDREGEIMGSCVGSGSYDADLKSGATTFLSLRDADGSPHATLQVRGRAFHEFRGKANQAPADKYRPAILWTMNRFDLPPTKMCSDLLSKLGLAWDPEAPKGRRYGPADEAGAEIGVFGGVLASRRQSKHQAEDGTIQSCGAPTYLLEGPSGRCSAVLGERLSIDGEADEAAVAALAKAAAEAGDVLPPPDPAAAELLSSLGWFHADGGYAPQMEMAKHLRTLPSGAEAKVLADHETGQQIVFYVGADGRRLATFALRRRAEVDRDRLYVLSKEEGFSGEAVSRDVVDLLEGLDVFLSDAKTASELGIVFCRLRWRYLPLRIFWEEMALELLAGDLSVRVEDDGSGGFVGTVRRVLSPVGRVHVVPQGERSPFHIVVSATPGEGDGAAKAVVFALNRLMFPTPLDDLGDRRVVFDRSLYAYGLRRPKKKGGGGPTKETKAPSLASKVAEALGIRRTAARLFKKGLEKAA